MDADLHSAEPDRPPASSMLSAISNEMVLIYKDQFGRGPTRTRTSWAGNDVLLVTLEETFTPAEHSLRRLGEHKQLRDLRLLFQYAEVDAFCEPVERLTVGAWTPADSGTVANGKRRV